MCMPLTKSEPNKSKTITAYKIFRPSNAGYDNLIPGLHSQFYHRYAVHKVGVWLKSTPTCWHAYLKPDTAKLELISTIEVVFRVRLRCILGYNRAAGVVRAREMKILPVCLVGKHLLTKADLAASGIKALRAA